MTAKRTYQIQITTHAQTGVLQNTESLSPVLFQIDDLL